MCKRGRALVSVGQTGRVVYCRRRRRHRCCAVYSVRRGRRCRFEDNRNTIIDTDIVRDHVCFIRTPRESGRNARTADDITVGGTRRR